LAAVFILAAPSAARLDGPPCVCFAWVTAREDRDMLAVVVYFEVKDEVKRHLSDPMVAREHVSKIVEDCREVPGMKQKLFFMNPETSGQGATLIFDTKENWEAYRDSALFAATVLDICEGEPRIETYLHTASLTDGVIF
jgi:hypothetical protein